MTTVNMNFYAVRNKKLSMTTMYVLLIYVLIDVYVCVIDDAM